MRSIKITLFCITIACLTSCASSYKMIAPQAISYISKNETDGLKIEYKYNLLRKKYAKKELKKGVKIAAVKITNNTDKDLTFGKDVLLTYENGRAVTVVDNQSTFKTLKQSPATYLFYLLLTPVKLFVTKSNGYEVQTNTTPIGLIIGTGLTGGNIIAASSANTKFKTELMEYDLHGTVLEKGKTTYGLIGIKTNYIEALNLTIQE